MTISMIIFDIIYNVSKGWLNGDYFNAFITVYDRPILMDNVRIVFSVMYGAWERSPYRIGQMFGDIFLCLVHSSLVAMI